MAHIVGPVVRDTRGGTVTSKTVNTVVPRSCRGVGDDPTATTEVTRVESGGGFVVGKQVVERFSSE